MSKYETLSRAPAFGCDGVADWIADGIAAAEEVTRGRYTRTSHLLLLALETLASEVRQEQVETSASSDGSERPGPRSDP